MALNSKAFKVWVLTAFTFMSIMSTIYAWILMVVEGPHFMVTIFSIGGSGLQIEVIIYLVAILMATFCFFGALCHVVFKSNDFKEALSQLNQDFEDRLDEKCREISSSTRETLTKLGLKEFRIKQGFKTLQKKAETLESEFRKNLADDIKNFELVNKRLSTIRKKIEELQKSHEELTILKKKAVVIKDIDENLQHVRRILEKVGSAPEPYLSSIYKLEVLEGRLLKKGTVKQLRSSGIITLEDLLLKSPLEIASTKAMSENEAKELHSIVQLLMIPGIRYEDAVLLLKSGVNSKNELALQDVLSLGARVSKTADVYVEEGIITKGERPTLEEVASWIRWAKT